MSLSHLPDCRCSSLNAFDENLFSPTSLLGSLGCSSLLLPLSLSFSLSYCFFLCPFFRCLVRFPQDAVRLRERGETDLSAIKNRRGFAFKLERLTAVSRRRGIHPPICEIGSEVWTSRGGAFDDRPLSFCAPRALLHEAPSLSFSLFLLLSFSLCLSLFLCHSLFLPFSHFSPVPRSSFSLVSFSLSVVVVIALAVPIIAYYVLSLSCFVTSTGHDDFATPYS